MRTDWATKLMSHLFFPIFPDVVVQLVPEAGRQNFPFGQNPLLRRRRRSPAFRRRAGQVQLVAVLHRQVLRRRRRPGNHSYFESSNWLLICAVLFCALDNISFFTPQLHLYQVSTARCRKVNYLVLKLNTIMRKV